MLSAFPIDTQRRSDVDKTLHDIIRPRIDVETTPRLGALHLVI